MDTNNDLVTNMKKKEQIKYFLVVLSILLAYILCARAIRVWSWIKTQETMFKKNATCEIFVVNDYLSGIRCESNL